MGSGLTKCSKPSKDGKEAAVPNAASPASGSTSSGASAAEKARKRAAMKQATLKNVRKVQDIYDMKGVLGTGGYAVVWSAVHKATKSDYAIKVMKATSSATPKDDEVTVVGRGGGLSLQKLETQLTRGGLEPATSRLHCLSPRATLEKAPPMT
jgi:serine/threonine protein kinase